VMADVSACTVVSKNHLAYARVLAESFVRHHPAARVFVLLVDRADGYIASQPEPFKLVELAALGIPDLPRFCFQYNILELNCAAKPYLLRYLLRRSDTSKLFYFDSDILVLRELAELRKLLNQHSILLTPHLSEDVTEDGRKPGPRHILESGAYNAGFIAVRKDSSAERFVEWLCRQVYRYCIADPGMGLFVDQRWLDLVPGMFDGVQVVRHPGYNVGHWSLSHRAVTRSNGDVLVEGQPLYFFHFSGLELDSLERLSKHQDRFTLDDVPALGPLFEEYRERVLKAGYLETREWPYAFGHFSNGVTIPPEVRRLYWGLGDRVERFGDPFDTEHPGSFWAWLNEEAHPGSGVSRLWYQIHLSRPDLQRAFPDVLEADCAAFLGWIRRYGRVEYGMPDAFDSPEGIVTDASGPAQMAVVTSPREPGLNVVGHAMSEKGVGEALRATVRALTAAGVPYCLIDFPDLGSANIDRTLLGFLEHNPYAVNLIHVNADALPYFVSVRGTRFLRGKYNIGFWMWELPEFPPAFHGAFAYLDEVWVGSNYCLEAVSRVSPLPVVKVPLALPAEGCTTMNVSRVHFGLPEESLIFLFIFDVHSVVERKNPIGLIRAFRRAFKGREDVRLVLKLTHGSRRIRQAFQDEAQDHRIIVLDRVLERTELNSLIQLSDCYVSLHRSEGFGVTIAEAMSLGKPAIATAYSANIDFMSPSNSFLVRYDLVRLERDYPPYTRGNVWADPDLDHAAELMRTVYENPDLAREVGQRAARDIWQYLAPQAVGDRIRRRLMIIESRLEGGGRGVAFGR
jgi:glycosyltransferase involved in cell wall biosynthesis